MGKKYHRVRSSRDLGQLIAAARQRRGLTQRQVACELGVSQPWVAEVEQGKQRAWVGQVLRLMAYLGIVLEGTIQDKSEASMPARDAGAQPNIDDLVD